MLREALVDLGAVEPRDVLDLDEDDVIALHLKKLEQKRWLQGVDELRTELAGGNPTAAAASVYAVSPIAATPHVPPAPAVSPGVAVAAPAPAAPAAPAVAAVPTPARLDAPSPAERHDTERRPAPARG